MFMSVGTAGRLTDRGAPGARLPVRLVFGAWGKQCIERRRNAARHRPHPGLGGALKQASCNSSSLQCPRLRLLSMTDSAHRVASIARRVSVLGDVASPRLPVEALIRVYTLAGTGGGGGLGHGPKEIIRRAGEAVATLKRTGRLGAGIRWLLEDMVDARGEDLHWWLPDSEQPLSGILGKCHSGVLAKVLVN